MTEVIFESAFEDSGFESSDGWRWDGNRFNGIKIIDLDGEKLLYEVHFDQGTLFDGDLRNRFVVEYVPSDGYSNLVTSGQKPLYRREKREELIRIALIILRLTVEVCEYQYSDD